MKNSQMKRQIEFSMRRVPRLGRGWRHIPIYDLPTGTEIVIETTKKKTPGQLQPLESEKINEFEKLNDEERQHYYDQRYIETLTEGRYRLFIGDGASATLEYPDGATEDVRPLHRLLAPTSALTMNVERRKHDRKTSDDPWTTTYIVQTGAISKVFIPGTRFTLTSRDGEVRRDPQRNSRRPGRQYTPLRTRRV
jgi:hypothetical protein